MSDRVTSKASRLEDAGLRAKASNLRCRVCRSLEGAEIDRRLFGCPDYASLLPKLSAEFGIAVESLRAHVVGGHSSTGRDAAPGRVSGEEGKVDVDGDLLSQDADRDVDTGVFLSSVIDAVATRLRTGALRPNVRDGVAASRLKIGMSKQPTDDPGYTRDDVMRIMVHYMNAIVAVASQEQLERFAGLVRKNPELIALDKEVESRRAAAARGGDRV